MEIIYVRAKMQDKCRSHY